MMGMVSCEEEAACVSQEEKEVLITSYLRLADLLKNVSSTICEQLTQQSESADHDTIAYNCAEIDHIIVQLKATTDLTESRRDEYNHLLVSITERILQIAKTTKDQQVADKINTLRREMERELKVVRNKNIKLTNSRSRAQIAAEQARHERDAAIAAQANAEKLLAEYRAQHPTYTLSASEQIQLQRLQTEVSKARRERDEAITAQQRLETQQSELKKQLEQTKKDKTSQVESDNTPISSPNIIDNTPTSPTATSVAAPITMSMPQSNKNWAIYRLFTAPAKTASNCANYLPAPLPKSSLPTTIHIASTAIGINYRCSVLMTYISPTSKPIYKEKLQA
jgi:Asp-tRNA(Asn)/Glu-tRNA(Gln) amidotransferase A subunit family amidase